MVPDDSVSQSKEKILADIDVAMGGHVAERMVMGTEKVTSGCGSDLQGATRMAYFAVRKAGMFGEDASWISSDKEDTSENYNAKVDKTVKKILDESFIRVEKLLLSKEKELRNVSKNLYQFDYLDEEELKKVIEGKTLEKEKVRTWRKEEPEYLIKF